MGRKAKVVRALKIGVNNVRKEIVREEIDCRKRNEDGEMFIGGD